MKNDYDHRIDGFRDRLEKAVRLKSGDDEMTVFQDTRDLLAGQEWATEIEDALRAARVLVVLFSPTWINSAYCRREFASFRQAGPTKTVIPVVWDQVEESKAKTPEAQAVLAAIPKIQSVDWSALKDLPWSDTRTRKAFGNLGSRIADAIAS